MIVSENELKGVVVGKYLAMRGGKNVTSSAEFAYEEALPFCQFKYQSRAVSQFIKFSYLCVQNSRYKTILSRVNLYLLFSRRIHRGKKSGDVFVC